MMIKPELDERGISQKEFAKMLGTQPSHLSEIPNGKRALTTELAVKRENSIGLPAKILPSAQTQYELESTNGNVTVSDGQRILILVIYDLSHCPIRSKRCGSQRFCGTIL